MAFSIDSKKIHSFWNSDKKNYFFNFFRLERGLQKFIVPIHLSHEVIPSAIFYGTVTPILCFFVAKKLLIDPYLDEIEERYKINLIKSIIFWIIILI